MFHNLAFRIETGLAIRVILSILEKIWHIAHVCMYKCLYLWMDGWNQL